MSKRKQVLLALAREVVALYGGQVATSPEIPQTEGQINATRKLTISESWGRFRPVPSLRLQGQWLEQAGFPTRARVLVQVQEGKIVLQGTRQK